MVGMASQMRWRVVQVLGRERGRERGERPRQVSQSIWVHVGSIQRPDAKCLCGRSGGKEAPMTGWAALGCPVPSGMLLREAGRDGSRRRKREKALDAWQSTVRCRYRSAAEADGRAREGHRDAWKCIVMQVAHAPVFLLVPSLIHHSVARVRLRRHPLGLW
ncbi:hypothetical protein LX36DRAFT_372596 [Colletotrichum falcatum]|nr:hypothetical protein LX36DRAFT_372596 [Colletotrichum falcatum]